MRSTIRIAVHVITAAVMAATFVSAQAPVSPTIALAASKGDITSVRALLKQGADANAAQGDGMTALHWAAERGDVPLAELLVYAGANVSAGTRIGHYTPLHIASRQGVGPIVRALLKGGANPSARAENGGVMPLHLAAESGSVDAVTALLDAGADANAKETEWGQTPLMFAAEFNRFGVINLLLKRGAQVDLKTNPVDLAKATALDRQATQLQKRILDSIVPRGQAPTPTQLQTAIEAERDLYLTGKMPDLPPLAVAGGAAGAGGGRGAGGAGAAGGGRAAGAAGAAAPANPFQDPAAGRAAGGAGTGTGGAAAVNQDDVQAAIDRASDAPPPPIISAKGGLTALHHAVRQGNVESVRALLTGGAKVDEKTGDGHSPLLVALINGQFDSAMELIKHGANPNLASDGHGVTPLWAAINARWQPRTRFPQPQEMELQQVTYLDVAKALLDKGADVNARIRVHPWYMVYTDCGNANCGLSNNAGSTAFWRAAYATDVEAMRFLVKNGADPNIPTMAQRPAGGRGGAGGAGGGAGAAGAAGQGGAAQTDGAVPAVATPAAAAAGRGGRAGGGGGAGGGDQSGVPVVPYGGPGVFPLQAAAGSEYGEGFAGNAHRHAPDQWLAAVKYLIEELGADVNARDFNGYNAIHHAASRGDNEMILYLVSKGGDVKAVSRKGQTTADMANGPVSRISPFPSTIALLEKLGSKNNHKCQSC